MSKKLRDIRRGLAGLPEPEAPKTKKISELKLEKEREGGVEFTLSPSTPTGRNNELGRLRSASQLQVYSQMVVAEGLRMDFSDLERRLSEAARDEYSYRLADMTPQQLEEALGVGQTHEVHVHTPWRVLNDSITVRPGDELRVYMDAGSGDDRTTYMGLESVPTGRLTAAEVARSMDRRPLLHPNDDSFVQVMAEAARREGWQLDNPRNVVPTGPSGRGLLEFRNTLARRLPNNVFGWNCQFFGFQRTRCLVLICANEQTGGRDLEGGFLVYASIPYVARYTCIEALTPSITPMEARSRAFHFYDQLSSLRR